MVLFNNIFVCRSDIKDGCHHSNTFIMWPTEEMFFFKLFLYLRPLIHCTKIFVLYKIQFFWVNQRPKMTTTTRFQRTLLKILVSLNWTSWVQGSFRWVASISAYVENIFIGLENKCCDHNMLYYCRPSVKGKDSLWRLF